MIRNRKRFIIVLIMVLGLHLIIDINKNNENIESYNNNIGGDFETNFEELDWNEDEWIYELVVDQRFRYYFKTIDEIENVLEQVIIESVPNTYQVNIIFEESFDNAGIYRIGTYDAISKVLKDEHGSKGYEISFRVSWNENLKSLYFNENIEVNQVINDNQLSFMASEIVDDLLKRNVKADEHIVKAGESSSVIAAKYDMSLKDLYGLNPWLANKEKTIQIGDRIVIEKLIPVLSVVQCFGVERENAITPQTIYRENENLFKGLEIVSSDGREGIILLNEEVEIMNNEVVSTVLLGETVILSAVDKVIDVGVKPVPIDGPAGFFISPLQEYRLSSSYGPRWGRTHKGLDMAVATGTDVKASDGGLVVFSGWDDSYGYRIDVEHKDGVVTRYAHNSQLLVSLGEIVGQGEVIAKSGNTGRSTGPHLHFELIIDGNAVNPLDHIS